MLARTADNLYWIARYMERAENLARTLRVTDRLSLMPSTADADGSEWHSTVVVSGSESDFYEKHEEATPENVISYLAFDPEILPAFEAASRWRGAMRARSALRLRPSNGNASTPRGSPCRGGTRPACAAAVCTAFLTG